MRQARVPWAEPKSRFTLMFERFAIDVLLETDVLGATRLLRISWDQAHHIMERAVERGLGRRAHARLKHLGVDEKAIAKRHRYATLLNDLERGVVLEVAEGRSKESLETCLASVPGEQLAAVEAFAMDMWQPYFQTVLSKVQDGASKVVFDRFHIVGHMNKAVDIVRRRENRELLAEGDRRLVGTKYDFLFAAERIDDDVRQRFVRMRDAGFKTARAWSIKELLRGLWDCTSRNSTLADLKRKLVTLWVINRQRDSLELLKEYMGAIPNAEVHVVRNGYFGEEKKFELYNGSNLRKAVEDKGGKSVTFPDLADRVSDDIYSKRLSIARAGKELPLGNRAELSRWKGEVAKMLSGITA